MSRACGVCGAHVPPPFRASAPELAPDLDLRPGEPTRSTLPDWLQTCRSCGAVAPDLAALPVTAGDIVRSAAYAGLRVEPADAAPFLRWAMLCPSEARAEAYLQAAWAADDTGADAASFRREAAAAWGEPRDVESALRLIDVLRRGRDFAAAAARADALDETALDENSARILAFQRARIAAGDAGRHLISSALRPPARMPHVAHGRPVAKRQPARGFWSKLLGGRA